MGTEAYLAIAFGVALGMFLTAAMLWLREWRTRKAVEDVGVRDAESTVRTLTELRSLGVHLAVDDFGTGYSPMSYLKRFPVQALKSTAPSSTASAANPRTAICTAVVSIARALGLRPVAESVETPEQLAELRTLGCELAQGYLFGKPAPAEEWGERPHEQHWAAFGAA